MSKVSLQLENIRDKIVQANKCEREADRWYRKLAYFSLRWFWMLRHEAIKDNVRVRAESLAYLMLYSFIPLLAGTFFVFSILTQFGMVQEALENFFKDFLSPFPADQRQVMEEWALVVKDKFLKNVNQGSNSLGIFSLGVFLWVGLKTLNNMDRTINIIWNADSNRHFLEQVRNFLVVSVAAPLVLTGSLSLPIIIRKVAESKQIAVDQVHFLTSLMSFLLPFGIVLLTFCLIYKLIPVRHVRWRSALTGAAVAAVALQITNTFVALYMRLGTHTVYGKAGVVLILGFWIFVVWLIVILGAEVSYLTDNQRYLVKSIKTPPSLYEAEALLAVMSRLIMAHKEGSGAIAYNQFFLITHLDSAALRRILNFLKEQGLIVRVAKSSQLMESEYLLAKDVTELKVSDLLRDFVLKNKPSLKKSPFKKSFEDSMEHWLSFFSNKTFANFLK